MRHDNAVNKDGKSVAPSSRHFPLPVMADVGLLMRSR